MRLRGFSLISLADWVERENRPTWLGLARSLVQEDDGVWLDEAQELIGICRCLSVCAWCSVSNWWKCLIVRQRLKRERGHTRGVGVRAKTFCQFCSVPVSFSCYAMAVSCFGLFSRMKFKFIIIRVYVRQRH